MARPKPLPFHRVRIVDGGEGRLPITPPWRPVSMPMVRIREHAGRDHPTAPGDTADLADPHSVAGGASASQGPVRVKAAEDALADGDEAAGAQTCNALQALAEAPDEPAAESPAQVQAEWAPPPGERSGASGVAFAPAPRGGALRAVSRIAREATFVRSLAELLLERCDDESLPDTGPWTLTLPLMAAGMGASTVDIWLSEERMALRFLCREPGLSRLLSRHRDALAETLQRELCWHPEVEIDVSDA